MVKFRELWTKRLNLWYFLYFSDLDFFVIIKNFKIINLLLRQILKNPSNLMKIKLKILPKWLWIMKIHIWVFRIMFVMIHFWWIIVYFIINFLNSMKFILKTNFYIKMSFLWFKYIIRYFIIFIMLKMCLKYWLVNSMRFEPKMKMNLKMSNYL